ncbi:hypothetical protein [Bradyrhizobium lablabi]|uniref:hypothetical protein n=1 Tax=Bradyrhizobium lablabi TaxID=722472 RepID=UPI001BA87D7A|nr:hypothetical protein [Bradyrhizobium lablabi]MBR0692566.1 hypothetical protein [Bradyrhizobium lablabi]
MTDWSAILARAFDKRLETGGDGGDSGDKFPKALEGIANRQAGIVTNENSQVVTVVTRPAAVTTASKEGGDKGPNPILAGFQPHRRPVTSVTTVTTDVDLPGGLAVDHLRSMTPPEAFDAARWHQLLIDADRFMQRRQHRAELPDWDDQALFGVHPRAPAACFGAMGLVLLVRGGEVVELEEGFARISTIGRSKLTCQKPRHADAIPIWTLTASLVGCDNSASGGKTGSSLPTSKMTRLT